MLLADISLYLNVEEYEQNLGSEFQFRSRYVCNYLRRKVRTLKFHANGFRSICVQGREVEEEACPILGENAAVPTVHFDRERYQSLGPGEHHEFFIGMLIKGFKKCARHHDIPLDVLMDIIEEFRCGGYQNEWLHQKKLFRGVGLRCSLLCRLDSEKFTLNILIEKNGRMVFRRQILETKPDEIIFAHRFKEVVFERGAIVVKDRFGKEVFSLELDCIPNG